MIDPEILLWNISSALWTWFLDPLLLIIRLTWIIVPDICLLWAHSKFVPLQLLFTCWLRHNYPFVSFPSHSHITDTATRFRLPTHTSSYPLSYIIFQLSDQLLCLHDHQLPHTSVWDWPFSFLLNSFLPLFSDSLVISWPSYLKMSRFLGPPLESAFSLLVDLAHFASPTPSWSVHVPCCTLVCGRSHPFSSSSP